jgi:hypothetical protein
MQFETLDPESRPQEQECSPDEGTIRSP